MTSKSEYKSKSKYKSKSEYEKDYHCCATCKNFSIKKENGKIVIKCNRLGYETKTHYKFSCWDPKPRIVQKIKDKK